MGDPEASNYRGGEPEVVLAESYLRHNGKTAYWAERTPEEQELLEEYGIEILSFEMPPPVENTFTQQ